VRRNSVELPSLANHDGQIAMPLRIGLQELEVQFAKISVHVT
jgi:hypothetical protein